MPISILNLESWHGAYEVGLSITIQELYDLPVREREEEESKVRLTLSLSSPVKIDLEFCFDLKDRTIKMPDPAMFDPSVTVDPATTNLAVCLAGCGLKGIAQVFFKCWQKGITRQKFINCLKRNGLALGASVLACMYDCFVQYSP